MGTKLCKYIVFWRTDFNYQSLLLFTFFLYLYILRKALYGLRKSIYGFSDFVSCYFAFNSF